jgi:hypothetical protein
MDVILYNQLGESLFLPAYDWNQLLDLATAAGWKSAGTLRPPVQLDIDGKAPSPWNGDYRVPVRQAVARADAQAFAAALGRSRPGPDAVLASCIPAASFSDFCGKGGFIICPADMGIGHQLCRLGAALESERDADVATEANAWESSSAKI